MVEFPWRFFNIRPPAPGCVRQDGISHHPRGPSKPTQPAQQDRASRERQWTGLPGPHQRPAGVRLLLAAPLFFQELFHRLRRAVAALIAAHFGGEGRVNGCGGERSHQNTGGGDGGLGHQKGHTDVARELQSQSTVSGAAPASAVSFLLPRTFPSEPTFHQRRGN